MSKVTDYSKWNIIEDDDNCEEERASEHSLVTFQKFNALKQDADKLFAAAECSRDPYDYKIALNQGYLISLDELNQLSQHNGNKREEITQFELSCKLNVACCHLRLTEFQRTINVCSSVLTDYQKIMSDDQIIRLRYFRGYSYCKLGSEENHFLADSDATEMKRMLTSMQTIHSPFVTEYRDFFLTLHEDRQKYLVLDELIRAESSYFQSGMKIAVRSKQGWVFYVQKNFILSSDWFASELLDLRNKSVDDKPNKDLFCDHYCGYGKSQLALSNRMEAAKAFLAAASYTGITETKISLNLRAASLCFKEGDYERAVSSYATALVLAEDSFTSTECEMNVPSDCPVNADTHLIIAVANVGLGMSYVRMKECSRALENLKGGIGFLTDKIFVKQKSNSQKNFPFTCPNTLMTFAPVETSRNEAHNEPSSITLPMIISRAQHLLNALESLSDAYADLREWEKAVYTANTSASVCNGLLEQLLSRDSGPTMTFTDDGTPNGSIAVHDNKNDVKSSSSDNNSSSSRGNSNSSNTNSKRSTLLLKDDVTAILTDKFCGSELKNDCLEVERGNFVSTVRKKRASALHAKGHMMKQILHHDVSRDTVKGEEKLSVISGPRPFDSMDSDLSLERFYDTSVYDTISSNISPADAITDLWTEAASEFNELGDHENALIIYTDLAAMWEGLGRIKPYCDSLYRIEERPMHIHTAQEDLSDTASNAKPSSSTLVTNNSVLSGDIHTVDNDDSGHQIVLPLKPFTPECVRRIYAAKKSSSLWLVAADVASSLCMKASSTDDSPFSTDTEFSDPSSGMVSEDVTSIEIQMTLCQQVIQCQYKAGLCALFYDMVGAEQLLGRAQVSKEKYQDLAGSLELAERSRQDLSSTSSSSTPLKDGSPSSKAEKRKAEWMNYNTLCCDISYHLAYAYIRLERIVYAIAEAEMAIGYAVQLPRGKERRRMCWGVLAVAFHVSGQALETERAMSEARSLQSSNASDENDDVLKTLSAYMTFMKVKKRIPFPLSSEIASKYSHIKPIIQGSEPFRDLRSDQSSTSNTSHKIKKKHFLNFFSYQAVAAFFILLVALLISFFIIRI